jgi:SAM-dependent methyltransferase
MKNQIFKCRVCGSEVTNDWLFQEMMFGSKKEFRYKECLSCGCIQIERYPAQIEDYYPENYYSFSNHLPQKKKVIERLKAFTWLCNHLVLNNIAGKMGKRTFVPFQNNLQFLQNVKLKPWSKILDIGCGNGDFLKQLYTLGFSHLVGIDKFIKEDIHLFKKIHIWKKEITELKTQFNLITMHHVFEHMPHQEMLLKSIGAKLTDNGTLIIRIPIINEAWDIYKEKWVQLDAPRHFYLHSINSFKLLAEKSGFRIIKTILDSYALQFWGSEQYRMDIPLRNDTRSYAENWKTTIFTADQILAWENKSIELNSNNKGDQAIFYLQKN